jgi:hypothetical protein
VGALLLSALASGQPLTATLQATLQDDLRTITGELHVPLNEGCTWVDPLAHLPEPEDDLNLARTYPGRPNKGEVRWETTAPGHHTFEASLPRRFGAVGSTPGALMAHGAWYPTMLCDGALPTLEWHVTVQLPERVTGALGNKAGTAKLTWSGASERVSLAAVRRGRLTEIEGAGYRVHLVSRRKPRKVLVRELDAGLTRMQQTRPQWELDLSAVQGRLRRRLVRAGPGLVYVSDRAYRLTGGLQRFHRVAVTRGALTAGVEAADPFTRDLVGAALSRAHAKALRGEDADRLLNRVAWIPSIDALLSSERMPFYSEILERTQPGDPVQDDLNEIHDPFTSGVAVLAQLAVTHGEEATDAVIDALLHGLDPREAAVKAGLPEDALTRWHVRYPANQDYTLYVWPGGSTVRVRRSAPKGSPPETVILRADDVDMPLELNPGEEREVQLEGSPKRITLDPDRLTAQADRIGEGWPRPMRITVAAGVETVHLTAPFSVSGSAWLTLRRRYDTRNRWSGWLSTDRVDTARATVGYTRKLGPLLDGWSRPHRLRGSIGASYLNPRFAESDAPIAADIGAGYTWDNRVSGEFPLRGSRAGISLGVGALPGTDVSWSSAAVSSTGLLPLHPRHVLAVSGSGALAVSDLAHRLLTLGGRGAMASIPSLPACDDGIRSTADEPCSQLADQRILARAEYRIAVLRNASVPMLLAWGSELHLAVGAEAMVARVGDDYASATGATVGLSGVGDVLGAEPTLIGVTAGWPLAFRGLDELSRSAWPQIDVRWSQHF